MTDLNELAKTLSDYIIKQASENWPGATLLHVTDGSGQKTDGYVWCSLGGSIVRCIVPNAFDLSEGEQVIYGVPLGIGPSCDYICIGVSWNGLDNSRMPRITTTQVTNEVGDDIAQGGTVTSVALSLPSQFAVSGSPVTTSGTLTGAWNAQTATHVLAGPTPSFRALAAADIPTIDHGSGLDGLTDDDHTIYLLRQPTASWVINDSGGDFDGRIEGDNDANLTVWDAGLDVMAIGGVAVTGQKLTLYTYADANHALVVKATNATQTANITEWQRSTAAVGSGVKADCNIFVCSTIVDTTGPNSGIDSSPGQYVNSTFAFIGFNVTPVFHGTGGTQANYNGGYFTPRIAGAASSAVTYFRAIHAQLDQASTSGAVVTDGVGLAVLTSVTTGTINNLYGIKIEDQIGGSVTNQALVTNAGNVIFNGGGDASTDFTVKSDSYDALFIDASSDSIDIMHHASGKVGFYAVAPTTQQVLATGAGATVDDVITALQTIGIVKQS